MKNFSFLIVIIFSLIFFSCKNDKKSVCLEDIKSENIDSLKINFKVLENDKRIKKINSFFQKKFSRNQFNGNILFAENGNIITEKSYGYSNFRKKEILTKEHSFQLASVSKPFTSIAILQLIENKKINLKDTIQKFFPVFVYATSSSIRNSMGSFENNWTFKQDISKRLSFSLIIPTLLIVY